ncbi:hypothetical protein [Streptomyces chattanoogensis]|nr:hypothetical protein T261_4387 [Streptomyces lydicus]
MTSWECLLEQQPASTVNWMGLTSFQFFSERALYRFLIRIAPAQRPAHNR